MKNLFIILVIIFISCVTVPRQEQKISPVQIVKQTYPDAFIVKQLPDYYYILIIENKKFAVVAVDKIKRKVVGKYFLGENDIEYLDSLKIRRYFCNQ